MDETGNSTRKPENDSPAREETRSARSRLWRRGGCALILAFWFTLLLSPCALIYLAANGEIRLWHGDIPQPHAHPLLLISLISETGDRGLRLERSWVASQDDSGRAICVETEARFLLWQSEGVAADAVYCECYQRDSAEMDWQPQIVNSGGCGAE